MDIQVVEWREVLSIERVEEAETGLVLVGKRLGETDLLLVNGQPKPFVQLTPQRLLLQETQLPKGAELVALHTPRNTPMEAAVLEFRLKPPRAPLRGLAVLIQRAALAIFSELTDGMWDVRRAVREAERKLKRTQLPSRPPEEALASMEMEEVVEADAEIFAGVRVTNAAGTSAVVPLTTEKKRV